ncbi:uncharacterized protein [Antedon mediterranea]|uniref:uncharacterized protein n=1 Tax=Antedon mediterranea TaxID=105859 RepID=UPI003AF93B88
MLVISPTKLGLVLVLSLLLTHIESAQLACSRCNSRACVCRCLNRIASLDPTMLPNFCRKRSFPESVQGHLEQEPTQTESSSDLSRCKKLMSLMQILLTSSAKERRILLNTCTDY